MKAMGYKIHDYHDKTILPFPEICRKVREGKNFAFARYGDGEFNAILGINGEANCDGHKYFPQMGHDLMWCFMDNVKNPKPNYFLGLHMSRDNGETSQPGYCGRETVEFLLRHNITPAERKFAQNAVFHDATGKKHGLDIQDFFDSVINHRVYIIGPAFLRRQDRIKPIQFIECPARNSYLATELILEGIQRVIQPNDVVLFCAGPPAPIWIDRLYREYKDTVTLIDFGSTLDPFAGRPSRSFHDKISIS